MTNAKKIIFYSLLLLNFLILLSYASNSFDNDLGWHLRFGKEMTSGPFPYLDTYTYSKYGQPWTNHEWGGDWLFWTVYKNLDYSALSIIIAMAVLLSFLIIGKAFLNKITIYYLLATIILQKSISHIITTRLATLAFVFVAALFYLMEKVKSKEKLIWLIPPLLWLWSAVHGSWVLGFIIINIYLGCEIFKIVFKNKLSILKNEDLWSKKLILKLIGVQFLSAILILINPYGFKIWVEIINYFSQSYYKQFTGEWIPSYSFPIYWQILIFQTIALTLAVYGFSKQKIKFTHLVLFIAFFINAILYKRQAIFIAFLSAPIFAETIIILKNSFLDKIYRFINFKILTLLAIPILLLLNLFYLTNLYFPRDVWNDQKLLTQNSYPYEAVEWVKQTYPNDIKIFNDFTWGGYLNWKIPEALVYFDGRGTATWMYKNNETMFEHYRNIMYKEGGLTEIEKDQANIILLRNSKFVPISKPNKMNNILFGTNAVLETYASKSNLEKEIEQSSDWKLVYSDGRVNIWENLNLAQ